MKQILCISYLPWQAQPNRTQQLLTRLSDAEILFFEPPTARGEPREEQGRRMRSHITVYTLPAPILPRLEQPALQRRSLDRAVRFIRKTMDAHRFREPVLWCTSPEQVMYLERFPCRGVVYDCHREWGEDFLDEESDLASRADVIFAASPGLVERLSPCSDNIALLPNGVNPLLFFRDDLTPPPHLKHLEGKTVFGCVGDLTGQTDLTPMLAAARTRPQWQFLLLGRMTQQAMSRLEAYPNIHAAGPVNGVELPDCLSVCSVLFDLKRTDDPAGWDVLPEYIYEYLATGKPVVTMIAPDQTEPFPDLIYAAYESEGFLRRIIKALQEDPSLPMQRTECARRNSWAMRVAEINRIFETTGLF